MGLFGCGGQGLELGEAEWNQRLVDAVSALDGVTGTAEFTYTLVGMFFSKDGWISGHVATDATSDDELRRILDEVGRAVVSVHRENYRNLARVTIDVVSADGTRALRFKDVIGKAVVGVDDIASFYGLPRH